jgi:hypothetical protein
MRCVSIVRCLYFNTFLASFLITFTYPGGGGHGGNSSGAIVCKA